MERMVQVPISFLQRVVDTLQACNGPIGAAVQVIGEAQQYAGPDEPAQDVEDVEVVELEKSNGKPEQTPVPSVLSAADEGYA